MSKVVLEKVKLAKILQTMHREINQSSQALTLKGGLDTEVMSIQLSQARPEDSIRLSQLLESQTFLKAFAKEKRNSNAIESNLLFNFWRIMKQKFCKVTQTVYIQSFPDFMIKYYENSMTIIANDTNHAL